MAGFIDLTGQRIGKWNVIRYVGSSMWECMSDDGEVKEIHSYSLRMRDERFRTKQSSQLEDLKGKRFNHWEVLEYAGSGLWKCRCDCGTISNIKGIVLKNGSSTKCKNCYNKERQEDLTGRQFGEWTVQYYAGDLRWHCKCSCGVEKDVLTRYLKNGTSKSCGHDRNYHIIKDDITGRQFGELTVLGYTGKNNMWHCRCSCGNEKDIHRDSLMTGKTKSCGCLKEKLRAQTLMEKYGDTNTMRIDNPREDWQIQIISDKELLIDFINKLGGKATAQDMAKILDVNLTTIIQVSHKFKLQDIILHTDEQSDIELSILNWLNSIGIKAYTGNRTVLYGKELDIYIPSKHLAIEVNGAYWHSSKLKPVEYHQNKTIDCAKRGIHLIHIFEYEWMNFEKREKIKSYIKSLLLDTENIIYAKNTTIRYIDVEKEKEFLEKYHFQGYAQSKIKLGCYNNDKLIGVATFGKPRFNSECEYELIRLCWHPEYTVVGGSEKLFKHFCRDFNPTSIVSYCDISKFDGKVYTRLGFKASVYDITKPNYIWVDKHNFDVLHSYQTMKKKLLSDGLGHLGNTEDEIMESLGYIKIYDSGNLKLTWKKEK